MLLSVIVVLLSDKGVPLVEGVGVSMWVDIFIPNLSKKPANLIMDMMIDINWINLKE